MAMSRMAAITDVITFLICFDRVIINILPVRIREICRRLWNFQKLYDNVRSSPRAIISHDILRLSPYILLLTAYCLFVK